MEVGQTYEVYWPHSTAGAFGTPYQYQTAFYGSVFFVDDTSSQIGVQGQVLLLLMMNVMTSLTSSMVWFFICPMGVDVVESAGSTTGTSVDNNCCCVLRSPHNF